MTGIDPLFGIHAEALQLQKRRMEVLAANVANADTPHYLARDVDFAKVLQSNQDAQPQATTLLRTSSAHLPGVAQESTQDPALVYRVPLQPSVDGNTVDAQVEQAKYTDAALHYQASLSFLDGQIKGLLTAITGN